MPRQARDKRKLKNIRFFLSFLHTQPRECRFVFIGKDLDTEALKEGFLACKCEAALRFNVGERVMARVYEVEGDEAYVVRRRLFWAGFRLFLNAVIYQDRLGTNMRCHKLKSRRFRFCFCRRVW